MRLGIRVARVSSRQGGLRLSGLRMQWVRSRICDICVSCVEVWGHFQSRRSGARPTNRRAQVDTPLVWSDTYAKIVYEVARGLR